MTITVTDLYTEFLPKTNCGDCSLPSCLAFASMVISERLPLGDCPYLSADVLTYYEHRLKNRYQADSRLKEALAFEALASVREKAALIKWEDLPDRIGGTLIYTGTEPALLLPYFNESLMVSKKEISVENGRSLALWEQICIYKYLVHAGSSEPTGEWKGFVEFPNAMPKVKSMKDLVESPLAERFSGKPDELLASAEALGGLNLTDHVQSADIALLFKPLPRIPVMLLFWDEDLEEDFFAEAKLRFDETIIQHLDIESIIFLGERLRKLLCGN